MDVEAIVWFGFRILSCRSTAKGAPLASFRSLSGFEKIQNKKKYPQTTLGPIGGMETPQTPFFRLYFFAPLCSLVPLGVLVSAGGPTVVGLVCHNAHKQQVLPMARIKCSSKVKTKRRSSAAPFWAHSEQRSGPIFRLVCNRYSSAAGGFFLSRGFSAVMLMRLLL